jgi:hypothetical protein
LNSFLKTIEKIVFSEFMDKSDSEVGEGA